MIVDWQIYYDAAKKCRDLADELRKADKPVHDAIKGDCLGMAGDAPGCADWGKAYDTAARQTLQASASLANALTNYGAVLYAIGHNYGVANKSNPSPPQPDVSQVGEYKVSLPSSVADNGPGLDDHGAVKEFFDKLLAKVLNTFGKLPNGDKNKLDRAHTVWDTFAKHPTVIGAAAGISGISAMFDGMDDATNRGLLQDHFATLKTSADTVATSAQQMAAPVADYRDATVALGSDTSSKINTLELTIAVTAIAGGLLALFSAGTSAVAATAAIDADVVTTMEAIQAAYQASRMKTVIGLAALAAGATATIDAFHALPTIDLDKAVTNLATIIAMKVIVAADGAMTVATKYEDLPQAPGIPLGGLTDESEAYVKGKHVQGGNNVTPDKSTFPEGTDLDALAEAAENVTARGPNDYGNYEREVDAGHPVGNKSQNNGGQPTNKYKVITDRWGTVVNMFPE
ncbi:MULTISPECIES: hypothetical protein [Nocardia]|uniref:hypothetical protein n=1 Tax=Nocardia TaxID=1817 RepID=UPI0007EA4B1B|nr:MULTISPECIES: hypothetical protein [Nocardia]MBF6278617.1 hypothetical protein [Nocardia nova]OBA51768.1 hypothetical protein A5789_27160 [Nocardia sp. 852002-51101_SCH5132738]OBB54154.1 hypothetical protein A5748_12840 [Nocardia sp. 852002-51244_SCH5132740]OBF85241.1 hypothetical protein A9X06_13625 [Mycobacterium sp. 852002-51759_SCH5129042]